MNQKKSFFRHNKLTISFIICSLMICGCQPNSPKAKDNDLTPVTLQTDWFAQPEYAGFYQALSTGLYEKHGLNVTINEGGPNADPFKKLLTKRCDLMNGRADKAIVSRARGLPVVFAGVTMQHNPLGILSHKENPINDFKDLDQKRIMVDVAAPWIDYIESKYNIKIIRMPHNFGLSHFLNDQSFVQQCFVTNEPFFVRQKGANPHVLPMWESGFDIYRGILAHDEFYKKNKDVVKKFLEATWEGWNDYLYNDPAPAHRLISERNPQMTEDLMNYIRSKIIEYGIIDGTSNNPQNIGKISATRLNEQIEQLLELGIIDKSVEFSEVFPMVPSSTF